MSTIDPSSSLQPLPAAFGDGRGGFPCATSTETASVPGVVTQRPASSAIAPPPATLRVLHIINGEHYSGAERVQDLLAAKLPEFGVEAVLACLKPGQFPQVRRSTAKLFATPMRSRFDFHIVGCLADLVRFEDCQLIHGHTPRTAMIGRIVAAWTGRPFVYHVHSPTARDSTRPLQNRLNAWTERLSLTGAAALITVSASLRDYMLRCGYPADRVWTVCNGVPAAAMQRSPQPPQGKWTLGMAALFRPRKGLEVLLEAIHLLRRAGIPVSLRAVGRFETAAYEQEIHRRVAELGIAQDIHWTGFCSDVGAELAKLDLFVLPSLFGEGLPMVVLEAMAAGVPVVASRVEGVPEAIEHGVQGVLVPPQSPNDLAAAIRGVMQGEFAWKQLREAALARHAAEFSDRSMASGVADVYRRVLANRGP